MSKKPTSSDVARLAGVSQSSVSLILNGSDKVSFSSATRERVLAAARTLGYQPKGRTGPQAAEQSAPDPHAHHLQSLLLRAVPGDRALRR